MVAYHHELDSPKISGTADLTAGTILDFGPGASLAQADVERVSGGVLCSVPFTGRFQANTNDNWMTANENFGPNNEAWTDDRGGGTDPAWIFNDNPWAVFPGGAVLEQAYVWMRANNTAVTDWQLDISCRYPTTDAAYGTGFDAEGEITTEICSRTARSAWANPAVSAAPTNDWVGQVLDIGYEIPPAATMGGLFLALQTTTTGATNRWVYTSINLTVRLP